MLFKIKTAKAQKKKGVPSTPFFFEIRQRPSQRRVELPAASVIANAGLLRLLCSQATMVYYAVVTNACSPSRRVMRKYFTAPKALKH